MRWARPRRRRASRSLGPRLAGRGAPEPRRWPGGAEGGGRAGRGRAPSKWPLPATGARAAAAAAAGARSLALAGLSCVAQSARAGSARAPVRPPRSPRPCCCSSLRQLCDSCSALLRMLVRSSFNPYRPRFFCASLCASTSRLILSVSGYRLIEKQANVPRADASWTLTRRQPFDEKLQLASVDRGGRCCGLCESVDFLITTVPRGAADATGRCHAEQQLPRRDVDPTILPRAVR